MVPLLFFDERLLNGLEDAYGYLPESEILKNHPTIQDFNG